MMVEMLRLAVETRALARWGHEPAPAPPHPTSMPPDPLFALTLTIPVVLWIYKTYAWQVPLAVYWVEFVMCTFYCVAYLTDQLRFQFDPGQPPDPDPDPDPAAAPPPASPRSAAATGTC